MAFTDSDIQIALDNLTNELSDDQRFVSVFFDGEAFTVRYTSIDRATSTSVRKVEVLDSSDGNLHSLSVSYEEGPNIVPSLGRVEDHEPLSDDTHEAVGPIAGGDPCQSARDLRYYGTITGIFPGFTIVASGLCNFQCRSAPALISNNHVIALSDHGAPGDAIHLGLDGTGPRIATLNCILDFQCKSDTDIASANLTQTDGVIFGEIRGIGFSKKARRPVIGETIRKYGARTRLSSGRVVSQANINVGGRLFRGVFATTGGFGCPGDSGSAVVETASTRILGVFSWSDQVPCAQNPIGYFFTLVNPGALTTSSLSQLTKSEFEIEIG